MKHPAGMTAYLWRRVSWRHAREEWLSSTLLLGLLAVGVAAFLSIRIANRAAVASFELFNQTVQPRSDWILRAPAGALPIERLAELHTMAGQLPITFVPVAELLGHPIEPISGGPRHARVVGLDLFALGSIADSLFQGFRKEAESESSDLPQGWLAPTLAASWEAKAGEALSLFLGPRKVTIQIAGILPERTGAGTTPENLVLLDLPDLLALQGPSAGLDRIEIILPKGAQWQPAVASLRDRLESAPAWTLSRPADEARGGEEMTAAFRLNLTILSLIALLVASYLIAQALDALVVRRRLEIGILRSLGLTEAMILRLWRYEFLVLGLLGGGVGLFLGWLFAQSTAGAVAETVNALYYTTDPPRGVQLHWTDTVLALGLGLGGSLVAGWLPLRDAARTPPAQVLAAGKTGHGVGFLKHPWPGVVMIAIGGLLWHLGPIRLPGGGRFPLAGYTVAFLWLIGGTFVVSALFAPLARALKLADGWSAPLRVARTRLEQASSRHRMAAAGLLVAVAMAAAMTILVNSFAQTMERWIDVRLRADLFVASTHQTGADALAEVPYELIAFLDNHEAVAAVDPMRLLPIDLPAGPTYLSASRQALVGDEQRVLWIEAPDRDVAADVPSAWVNEAFVERFGHGRGDRIAVPTPDGSATVAITGVFADYGNEQGLLWVDWATFHRWFEEGPITNVSIFLHEDADFVALNDALRAAFPTLVVRDNAGLRAEILRIFRQTFAVTEALKLIGLIVALGGLALALSNHLRESRTELRTLRLIGCRRREIALSSAYESVGIAAVGLLGGIALSLALGALLVFVINKQSFGWTLQWAIPWASFGGLAMGTLTLALAVGATVGFHHAKAGRER